MLKLTYTENGFHLEHLTQSLEKWVTTRVFLALRSGTGLCIEPSTACFLLPRNVPYLTDLEKLTQGENREILELSYCDAESVEVSLQGTWISSDVESDEGLFVCVMSEQAEAFLYELWKEVQFGAYVVGE